MRFRPNFATNWIKRDSPRNGRAREYWNSRYTAKKKKLFFSYFFLQCMVVLLSERYREVVCAAVWAEEALKTQSSWKAKKKNTPWALAWRAEEITLFKFCNQHNFVVWEIFNIVGTHITFHTSIYQVERSFSPLSSLVGLCRLGMAICALIHHVKKALRSSCAAAVAVVFSWQKRRRSENKT